MLIRPQDKKAWPFDEEPIGVAHFSCEEKMRDLSDSNTSVDEVRLDARTLQFYLLAMKSTYSQ